ncbi:MAG: trigger factor [Lentisphaerae bacterium]|nr:trigger factor [Lentisphaerota bacterium]
MDVKVMDAGPCRKILQIQAPPETVAGEYEQAVKAYAAVARLPGFRPGKAPLKLVERQFAKQIESETKDRLVPRLYREALTQEKLKPVAVVEVKDVVLAKASGLGFNVTVDLAPEFELPNYRAIPVAAQPVQVTDADVDAAVLRIRERVARFEPITGRAAGENDLLRVDYTASIDGKPLAEVLPSERALGEAKDFLVYLGEPEFLPGFTAALKGATLDETRDISVTFPDAYAVKALAGRHVAYRVTVKGLQQRVLPELNDEFLKQLQVESEAALRERLRADLQAGAEEREAARQKDEVARFLLGQADFDLPQSVVEQETRMAVRNIVQDISRRGATKEQIVEQQDQIVNHATQSSTERVRLTYILGRIAEAESLTVEDADVNERIQSMATRYEMPPERMREELIKRDALDNLRADIRADKTLSFLLNAAKAK